MVAPFQFFSVIGIPLSKTRRVLAIDAGVHAIKIVLVESGRGPARILESRLIEVAEEGLVTAEEIGRAIGETVREMGDWPVALVLPQSVPLSQLVDVSAGTEGVKQLIEQETLKNRDASDSPLVYAFAPLRPFGKYSNPFWVTLSKESDIHQEVARLALPEEEVVEIVSSPNALLAAYLETTTTREPLILADLSATSTQVVIVMEGQAVHSASFPIGGNFFTDTIAIQKQITVPEAEKLKRTENLLSGREKLPGLQPVAEDWQAELERIVGQWLGENPQLKIVPTALKVVLSGGGALQMGLLGYLNRDGQGRFVLFQGGDRREFPEPAAQFILAFGGAVLALGGLAQTSLLPARLRERCKKLKSHQRLLAFGSLLLIIVALLLAVGTWQKFSLIARRQYLLQQANMALEQAAETENLERDLGLKYERLRPVLRREQQTVNTLQTLSLLDQTKQNRNAWYVLFADQLSYGAGRTTGTTNSFTNAVGAAVPAKAGFVAELCINEEGEAMRRTLAQIVADLKRSSYFSNVDTLPADRRRPLAEPKVVLTEKHFALGMEMAGAEFQRPLFLDGGSTNPVAVGAAPEGFGTNRVGGARDF